MEKRKKSIGKMLITLVAILVGIIVFSYLENPVKINTALKQEAMSTEEIQNVGKNAVVSGLTVTKRLTGTGEFDSNDAPGNDSSEENDIVRSFDQITWTIESAMALKDLNGTALKGGKLKIDAELPESLANIVKWDLDSMKWAENAKVSENGVKLTAYYTMRDDEVTIPGSHNLVVVLKVLGAANGTQIQPTFTVNLVGSNKSDAKSITDSAVKVSAKPSYNVELVRNESLNKVVQLSSEGTTGRLSGYFLGLQLYNDNPSKGMKGIEIPKGNITFDIDLKLKRSENKSEGDAVDITSQATPILYNYALNESTNTEGNIAGRPMNGHAARSQYSFDYPANNKHGESESVNNSGSISMAQEGSKIHVTINNYEISDVFPKTRYKNETITITNNIGYFGAYYFQVLVPYTDATTTENSTYWLSVANEKFSATSLGGTSVSNQVLGTDDSASYDFVKYTVGQYSEGNWLKTGWNTGNSLGKGGLYTTYDQGDAKAGVGQNFVAKTVVTSDANNSIEHVIHSAKSILKFDGQAFEISEIDGKEWNLEESSDYKVISHNSGNMNFKMLYVAKKGNLVLEKDSNGTVTSISVDTAGKGTNWASDEEMGYAEEEHLLVYNSLQALKNDLGNQAVCVGVLWESTSGTLEPGSDYALGLALKVTNKAQIGNVYQFASVHNLYKEDGELTKTTSSGTSSTFNYGRYYGKTVYDANGNMTDGSHKGGYKYGQSLLIINGEASVQKTVADLSDGKAKVNYDLGHNETVVTYNIKPMLKTTEGSSDKISGITVTLTDTLPKGLKYIKGSSNSAYGEPTTTENSDGTTTLVWKKANCTLDEDMPQLTFKAAIDLRSDNGAAYTNTVLIEADKLVKTPETTRTATATINIIKLVSYSLNKETETPLIEKNGEGSYNVIMLNMTNESVPEFQLLDILPYNGDGIETSYNGTYTVSKIELSGNVTGEPISVDNLRIAITESESVRSGVTVKDASLGNGGIWETVSNGAEINKPVTAFSVVGELPAATQLIAKVYIKTNGNEGGDQYRNSATVQTSAATVAIESPIATIQVISRTIEGQVWLDNNEDGLMNSGDQYMKGVPVTLLNEDGTPAKDINGNTVETVKTAEKGAYKFENLAKGKYIVQISGYEAKYEITKKNVGDNSAINSKVNSDGKTDVLTKLNVDGSAQEEHVNAGIVHKKTHVIVHHYIIDENGNKTTEQVPLADGTKAADQTIEGKVSDDYTTSAKTDAELGNRYKLVETPENASGKMTATPIEITYYYAKVPAKLIVHHYFYDEETEQYTTIKLAEDELTNGHIGDEYTTSKSPLVPQNYTCLDETPDNYAGQMLNDVTEVTYYYKLAKETVENTITKTAKANKTVDGEEVLTQEDGKVTYTIKYNVSIKDYIGKAKITLVDTLPAKIDVSRSNLAGGTYNEETNTITWEQTIEGIDTYASENQTYTNTIEKVIEIVYEGQDVNAELVNVVKGTTVTYYPDEHPTKPGEEKTTVEAETKEPIIQEYKVDRMVEKVWEDDDNAKGKRPQGIEAVLTANGEKVQSVVLSNKNNWKHVFNRLNKYTENGELIKYEITEKEVNEGDLDSYEKAKISVSGDTTTITNTLREEGKIIVEYKDIDTNEDIPYIDENGEEKTYNYEEKDYVGEDYKTEEKDIPYYELVKIPENKEGKFKKEDQTITYYYRKLPFNIGVEKTVKEIILNGESKDVEDGKLAKIEIPESKLSNTEMIVKYRIVVKNTGKVEGTAEVVDTIPAEFELASENPTYWTALQGGKIQTNVDLKVGEEKELEVVLKWKNSSQTLGTTKNVAEITNTDNTPKYPDNNPDDNISTAELIISVKTGTEIMSEILLISGTIGLVMLLATTLVDVKVSNRKK